MRILIVNNFSYITGGADRHCFDLAQILREAGHEVAFLSTSAPQNIEAAGGFVALRVTNLTRDEMAYGDRARIAATSIWNRPAQGAMRRLLREFRPDVVHSHKIYPHLSVAPIVAARSLGVPIVQTVHDYEFVSANSLDDTGLRVDRRETRLQYRALNTGLFQVKRRLHVPAVSTWVAVSKAVKETYAHHGIDCTAIPNFTLKGTDTVPGFDARRGVFYAGRLTLAKGINDVIEVARALPDLRTRVAGQGELAEHLQVAASELSNLEYLGTLSQDEVQRELRGSRVCVVPSRWQEPGPLACLEAMAAGTPVLAYRAGGLAEYVQEAGAGRVVSEDPNLLADACWALATSREAWDEASAMAVQAIRGTHSPERYLQSVLAAYRQASRSTPGD